MGIASLPTAPSRLRQRSESSAFDNAQKIAEGQNSLLENYLTDSIHVKC